MPSQGSDFNRMLQQHLSENPSTAFRSTLHNIQEIEQDENAENPISPEMSPSHHRSSTPAMMGSITTGASHREGPMSSSHDRGLFHSLYGQTAVGGFEPITSDLTTADMCLSTLYLHELFHRQNRRRSGSAARAHSLSQHQQQQWHAPHRDGGTISQSHMGSHSRSGGIAGAGSGEQRSAAEKTPLLYPKKT